MQKKSIVKIFFCRILQKRIMSIIGLTSALLIGLTLSVNASTKMQNVLVSLNYEKVKVKKVLVEISRQTSYEFLYSQKYVDENKEIEAKFQKEKLSVVMDKLFGDIYNISYKRNIIMLSPKSKTDDKKDKKKDGYITGKVIDEKCHSMPGVTVVVQGTKIGVSTDARGKYKIKAKKGDALRFTFVGYKTQLILIKDKDKIDVKMQPKAEMLKETTVVAFGEQKKESVVSAITTVKSEALKSSNSDLTSQFAGKVAGVIGWQTGGMPGALTEEEMNTKFYVRGITSYQTSANIDPLILLDGIEASKLDLARIDPDDIESFNVMKDAAATAMYGARGANGVIYVKTKKGKQGNVRTTFRYERIWSKPTEEIDVVDPKEHMRLFNQAVLSRGLLETPVYSKERIDRTNDPRYPDWVFPGTDWYKKLFKDKAVNNHYSLNVRGGGSKIQYYVSVVHNNDEGMIKTDRLNQFDCNIESKQTNFRSNININLNKTAKLTLNSFSTYDNYHGPLANVYQAYSLAFNADPVAFAPTYPADNRYNWPHILFGSNDTPNPYAVIQQGYKDQVRFSTINKFEYIQNLSRFVKGLELRASVGLTKVGYFSNSYRYTPAYYSLISYDFTTGEHQLVPLNEVYADSKIRKDNSLSVKNSTTVMDYSLKLLHTAAWKDHQTSFTGVFTARESDDSTPQTLTESLPHRNINIAGRATYGYKDKYFLETSCGINGSERFAEDNRIGVFPAVGGAWVVSKENFMRPLSNWLSYLKVRFSYGITGNDGVIKDPRFLYLQDIRYSENKVYYGYPAKEQFYYEVHDYGNKKTEWETSEQTNLGLEFKLFKGLIDVNMDIYSMTRHNIYDYRRTIPLTTGLVMSPLDNVGSVSAHGLDFSGKIQKAFSPDFWVMLNGVFTYNRAKFSKIEEPQGKMDWQKKVGHDISQQYCYIADGIFQDQQEIDNSPYQAGDIQPGDIRYKDLNGDGKIGIDDAIMTGYPETPRMIYGFNGFVHYKNLEFSFAFQGSGERSFFIDPVKISPFYGNKACLSAIANDHWTEENHAAQPFWPKLSINEISQHNPQENYYENKSEVRKSTYFMRDGKFLRCKSLELAYYVSKKLLEKVNIKNFRVFARANNPFVISDFKLWDIELGENGFNYPIQKTYSIGFNLSF